MINKKILSGYELVAKGATKIEATLPELGLKDVFPSKTWLEEKQIQAAVEARKHLIEVQRIDKSGVLSHAQWNEELMLAEVTQKVGSCWQYFGHNVGKKLYLKPEEALFLLEINNLCLKHNDVKVSLQQAYSLLLRDKVTLLQYKVYASLSRIGYRVYRHNTPEVTEEEAQKINSPDEKNEVAVSQTEEICMEPSNSANDNENHQQNADSAKLNPVKMSHENIVTKQEINEDSTNSMPTKQEHTKCKKQIMYLKMQSLNNRQLIPCNNEKLHKYFDNIPDLLDKNIATISTPFSNLLPNTINLTKSAYIVNLHDIQNKQNSTRPLSTESNIYSVNDEVNGSHIRRLRNTSNRTESNWTPPATSGFATQQNTQYRPSYYWRRASFNYYNFNNPFPRPFLPNWYFVPNLNFYPRAQSYIWRPNFYINNRNYNRKRSRKGAKKHQLDGILKLAGRLKQLIQSGNTHQQNIHSLQRLIQTYNTRYKTKVRLNSTFDVFIDETIEDTITLDDDDEEPSTKRRKANPAFEENLNKLKTVASKLKELEYKDKSSGKHRRAFSKLIKMFNDSYKEDYYLNEDYEIVCRNQIDLDTSDSDNDCIIEESQPSVSGKKLKNPFNVLKRVSITQNSQQTGINLDNTDNIVIESDKKYSEATLNAFTKDWLPKEDDFGRAEIVTKDACSIEDIRREEFLYDFIKIQTCKYDNWLDLKKSFFISIQAAIAEFQDNMPRRAKMEIDSIVKPEDCADLQSVLKKLSIIKSDKSVTDKCNLAIDFDVYNRNVQNFKKSNRPTPHFRIICINESSNLPAGEEIAALHTKYADNVTIVFAIVGIDSISYVQINPTDLPVYVSNNT
ncbi:uncharacterized protein LOC112050578 [Bicyclus anynana]|uniref:Uncharacterized protein LOC112050578 n=1 Tax=Bicyclus anynana TaxID=110368 RepID=A0A6J1NI84_BICAN|nr:uncharacterized protein LOC112050578 [Bicyclus anynana]